MRLRSLVPQGCTRGGAAVLALAVAWIAVLVTGIGGSTVSRNLADLGLVVAAFGAAAACFRTARYSEWHERTWFLLGGASLSWGVGRLIWTAYEAIPGSGGVPFPSFADIGFLAFFPLAAAALLTLPTVSEHRSGWLRKLWDGVIIAGSLLLTSWVFVLKDVHGAGGDSLLAKSVGLGHPVGDVVVATIVLYAVVRIRETRAGAAVPFGLIGGGLAALCVADSGFAYLRATGSYSSGGLVDIVWVAGFAALAVAGLRDPQTVDEHDFLDVVESPIPLLLPYCAVLIALAASSFELLRTGANHLFMAWVATAVMLALVARQMVTLLENVSLTRHLSARSTDLRASEQRFEALVQHSSDVVTVVNVHGAVEYQSDSIQRVFGYESDSLLGTAIDELFDAQSAERLHKTIVDLAPEPYANRVLELTLRHATGRLCHAEVTITNLLEDGDVEGFVLNTRDISERKMLQDQLVHEASHDALTDLANRALFADRIEDVLRRGFRDGYFAAVLYMDLDGFKSVNDSLGHATGDLVLVEFGERLANCVRPSDLVARLGGDEFAVLITDLDDYQPTLGISKRITRELKRPFLIDGHEITLSTSIGIAATEGDVITADQLLRNADLAMYRAKNAGEGSYAIYDPKMHARLVERLQLEADLRRALDAGDELLLHYQPTVTLPNGQLKGFEALIRWQHPTRGFVSPDQFIPIAEETGLIRPLGKWVLEQACQQLAAWRSSHDVPWLTMSVNISGNQLRSRSLVHDVAGALKESGVPPDCLILEITEGVLMDHSEENLELLGAFKDMGLRLAIDDFGTGYSSLSYLHRFPIDILKVDRVFVERLGNTAEDFEFVATIIRLGQSLRMMTTAEGVENQQQVDLLHQLGCDLAQGFLFSRPVEPGAAEDVVRRQVLLPDVPHEQRADEAA